MTQKMKLYLHIGTEKTGTTFLQKFLYGNRQRLSDQSVFLSNFLSTPNNRSLVHYFSDREDDFWAQNGIKTLEDKARHYDGFLEGLTEEIRSAERTHDIMLITSEHFHSRLVDEASVRKLAKFLSGLFREVEVICYLREQSAVRKSLYSTNLKGRGTQPYASFGADEDENSTYYNYYNLVTRWSNVFGAKAMKLRLYDRGQFAGNDLRTDFLSLLGDKIKPAALDFQMSSANESLSLLQAEAFRAINENCNRYLEGGGFNPVNVQLKKAATTAQTLKRGGISDPDQVQFFERFKESNERLFHEFLPGTPPFREPVVSVPQYNEKEFSLNELAVIVHSVFAEITKTIDAVALQDKDATILRDIALKYERNDALSKDDAISLMELAARARPSGSTIRKKLKSWKNDT